MKRTCENCYWLEIKGYKYGCCKAKWKVKRLRLPRPFCICFEKKGRGLTMREHMGLYRGKRKDKGEWVEGGLYEQKEMHESCFFIVRTAVKMGITA